MKKIIALFLSISLVLTYMPMTFAADSATPEDAPKVTLDQQAGTFDQVSEVVVCVDNPGADKISGDISITAPNGWELKTTTGKFTAESGQIAKVKFAVTKKTKVAFNMYFFDVTATDSSKAEIFKGSLPLPFSAVVKADKEIDIVGSKGDISDWSDAYPVYIAPPKDSKDLSAWQASDVAGICFMKWDDKNLYILVNDYDDAYVQETTGESVWTNDNVQVSIDCLDTKTNGYDADDYEYGISYTKNKVEMFTWHAPDGKAQGQYPASLGSVYRDDDKLITRFLMKLDTDHIAPLPLKEGTKFGLNYVLNDADGTSRESAPQLTSGTADGKNPIKYKDFVLVGSEKGNDVSEVASLNLPLYLSIDAENSFKEYDATHKPTPTPTATPKPTPRPKPNAEPMFSDVTDHWARADIEDMAKRGVINGIGNGLFAPDLNITRAEFVALLTKTANPLSEYKGGLSDVTADLWSAKYIQTGIDLGIIPAEMTASGSFAPEQPITREEMCAMIVNAYKHNTAKDLAAGDSGTFTDESSFTPWAVNSINAAAKAKIVNGVGNGLFDAKANATRAEAATIVRRLLDMN